MCWRAVKQKSNQTKAFELARDIFSPEGSSDQSIWTTILSTKYNEPFGLLEVPLIFHPPIDSKSITFLFNDEFVFEFHWKQVVYVYILTKRYEPPLDKTNEMTVRPAKTQIAWHLNLRWAHSHLVDFVMRWLICHILDKSHCAFLPEKVRRSPRISCPGPSSTMTIAQPDGHTISSESLSIRLYSGQTERYFASHEILTTYTPNLLLKFTSLPITSIHDSNV